MKKLLSILVAALALAACGNIDCNKKCPTCPDCPPEVTCPTPDPCPDCPTCPDCPPCDPNTVCDPNVICPKPPTPPTYPDLPASSQQFEMTAVLAAPKTLGLYVVDPNGQFNSAVFAMPQLQQKWEFEEVLVLQTDASNSEGGQTGIFEVGRIEGAEDPYGLVIASLCNGEFEDQCIATITTNGPDITKLTIDLIALDQPGNPFTWEANK